jgi:hypothetical protein
MLTKPEPLRLVYSYAREDDELCRQLETRIAVLERDGLVAQWRDSRVTAGERWHKEVQRQFQLAEVIVLMFSDDFMASRYIREHEWTIAWDKYQDGSALVIPLLVRPTAGWEEQPFQEVNALPRTMVPVTLWPDRDSAWAHVADEIRQAVRARQGVGGRHTRRSALQLSLLTLGLSALAFGGAKATHTWLGKPVAPAWLTTDMMPKIALVVRLADDLVVASGHYLVRVPDGAKDFARQLNAMTTMLSSYNQAVDALQERRDFYRDELDQLRQADRELSYAASDALNFVLAEFTQMNLPTRDERADVRQQFTTFSAAWREHDTRTRDVLTDARARNTRVSNLVLHRIGVDVCNTNHRFFAPRRS